MREVLSLSLVVMTACASAMPPLRPVTVAEGKRHVFTIESSTMSASDVASWYATAMQTRIPALRDSAGNIAVYVLRRDEDSRVTMTIVSEWMSREDFERCRSAGTCATPSDGAEVLFEAVR